MCDYHIIELISSFGISLHLYEVFVRYRHNESLRVRIKAEKMLFTVFVV